ncbi:LysR family transcriptional regulator [Amycolatopsis sp. WGS_07]|uniref:LysR family transcriptional regulator n=1 Tax=Amycolatopsis sp. WGS_07 TaxID=3076764 RepID=UPI0038736D29
MISADDLGIFLEVARRGRLTEAAKHLGLNHTTVGRHIAHLERTAEQRLFHREPSGWTLTAAGTRLLEHAEAVEAAVLAAREDCLQTGRYLTGTVRVIAPDGFGTFLLAPGLHRLAGEFPALSLEFVIANVHASLSTREFDLAITIERPITRAVDARLLANYELRLYAAPALLESHGPLASADDLADAPFLWYTEDALCAPTLETLFRAVPAARPVYRTNTISGQICAARQGLGFAFLPSWIGDHTDGLRPIETFPHAVPHSYWLLIPHALARLARVRAVSAAIDGLVRERPLLHRPQ